MYHTCTTPSPVKLCQTLPIDFRGMRDFNALKRPWFGKMQDFKCHNHDVAGSSPSQTTIVTYFFKTPNKVHFQGIPDGNQFLDFIRQKYFFVKVRLCTTPCTTVPAVRGRRKHIIEPLDIRRNIPSARGRRLHSVDDALNPRQIPAARGKRLYGYKTRTT